MVKHIIVFSTLVSSMTPAIAREITLKEVVQRYVENAPELRSARSTYMASYYDKKKAVSRFFPNLSLNGSMTDYENPTLGSSPLVPTTGKKYAGSLDLVQPILAGGAIWNGLKYADLNKSLQEQTYLLTKQESLAGVLAIALQLGAIKEQIKVIEDSQKYQERFYKLTQSKAQRGAAKNYELSSAKANYLAYGSRLASLKSSYEDLQTKLQVSLGLNKDQKLEFTLPTPSKVEAMDFDKLLEQANQNRPKVKAAEIGVEVAKAAKWIALADELPSANIVGSIGYQSPTQDDFGKDSTKYQSIGVTLKIPLFSGLSSIHKHQSGGESVRVAEENLAAARNTTLQDVRASLNSLNLANELVTSTSEWATEARRALNSSIDSYKNGIVPSVQVIQSQSGWESAELSLINAKQSFQSAMLNLRKSIGVDLEKVYTEY